MAGCTESGQRLAALAGAVKSESDAAGCWLLGAGLPGDLTCFLSIDVCIIVPYYDFKELGVNLHGIDDSTEACEQIWQTCADTRDPATGRVIALFREALEKVQVAELERLHDRLPKLNERSRLEIRQFADRLVAKMLDPPLESLRDESHHGSPQALLEALQRLFQLCD